MISSSWDIKCNRLKLVILGQFLPFCPFPPNPCLKLQKSKFLKNEKNCWWYHHLNVYQKSQSYDVQFLRYEWGRQKFLSYWAIFYPFTPLTICKIKIFRKRRYYWFTLVYHNWKAYRVWNTWRYHRVTHVHQKLWSHDVRFLRYGARRTDGRKVTYRGGCPT